MAAQRDQTMRNKGHPFLLAIIKVGLGLTLVDCAAAQTFEVLHTFTSPSGPNATNSDGASPSGGLFLSGSTLYGTATYGGSYGWGTVFVLNTDGTGYTTTYHFTGASDGANPYAGVILSNNTLYGTASAGGSSGAGTVFALSPDGTGFTNLHSFTVPLSDSLGFRTNGDGAYPYAGLILSGNTLYGAANDGGTSGHGTLFAVEAHGGGFSILHSFSSGTGGAYSSSGLVLLGSLLYGTDYGNLGKGTVFAINTNSTGFTNYYAFSSGHLNGSSILTNSDGANPRSKLILSGNTFYGTAEHGGSSGNGTLFAINADGTDFRTLRSFAAGAHNSLGLYTNSDGTNPSAELVLLGNSLYGTANAGGSSGNGTVFMINTDGTGFTNLYNFTATPPYPQPQTNMDGASPSGGLALSGYTFYGTTAYGGSLGNGTVFSLSFAPQLTIRASGTNAILSWPTSAFGFDYTGFVLQAAPSVTGTFTNVSGATSPHTSPIAGAQQVYRLSR